MHKGCSSTKKFQKGGEREGTRSPKNDVEHYGLSIEKILDFEWPKAA